MGQASVPMGDYCRLPGSRSLEPASVCGAERRLGGSGRSGGGSMLGGCLNCGCGFGCPASRWSGYARQVLKVVIDIVRKREGQRTFEVLPRRWVVDQPVPTAGARLRAAA